MKGTIRIVVGLLVTLGAVGGMDTASDAELLVLVPAALLALAMMYSGVVDMNRANA